MWSSVDPRSLQVVPYSNQATDDLEAAYQGGAEECVLTLQGSRFVVRFSEMRQYNAAGLSREVRRTGAPRAPPRVEVVPFDPAVLKQAISVVDKFQPSIAKCREQLSNRRYRWKTITQGDAEPLLAVYQHILELLASEGLRARFGGSADDVKLCREPVGSPVQPYFANVSDGSIYRRKVLSVLGLRNLVLHGGDIFNDLLAKLFSGDASDYPARCGLSKMKTFTGNTVDLDTVVLNPSRQLKELCHMAGKQFSSAAHFERDPLCRQMVLAQALQLISEFEMELKLTAEEMKRRHLILPSEGEDIHLAQCNMDRGRHSVWHYQNVGVSTFHVNVPNLADVIGALLAAPLHAIRGFALALSHADSPEQGVAEYFEECISDSCFNGKWKAIEAFIDKWERCGDIAHVLSELQRRHQDEFAKLAENPDREEEAALMLRFVRDEELSGVDPTTKTKRRINAADVEAWIKMTD